MIGSLQREGRRSAAADRNWQVGRDYESTEACATQEAKCRASSRPVRRLATAIRADGCSRCAIRRRDRVVHLFEGTSARPINPHFKGLDKFLRLACTRRAEHRGFSSRPRRPRVQHLSSANLSLAIRPNQVKNAALSLPPGNRGPAGELHAASDMDSLAYLARRFRCSDCGEKKINIEPIWHRHWIRKHLQRP